MIVKTEATVLQIRAWGNTSHMVTWLSPEYGSITTVVKGACRPKSAFLGQYDLFYTCDLLFYRREREGVHAIRECYPKQIRESLRSNWRACGVAAYIATLVTYTTMSQQRSEELFLLLNKMLDQLANSPIEYFAPLMLSYELQLLQVMGVMPDFKPCPECHDNSVQWLPFALASGCFTCQHRQTHKVDEPIINLPRKILPIIGELTLQSIENPLETTSNFPALEEKNFPQMKLLLGLSRFLGIFIPFHLDLPAAIRRAAWEMVG